MDLGTKGSGTTPYSRGGDGRLTLKGGVREILASSLLAYRGVNVSRALCLVETHENLIRYDEPSPTRSAVLTRLSHGHLRIGTFERLAYENDLETMEGLMVYCLRHLFSQTIPPTPQDLAVQFFDTVITKTSQALGQMMAAGFVHGVLNSDNINITGEVFDFGPFRFLTDWDETLTAAYFDEGGLYAFGRQPQAYLWNLTSLGQCLSPFDDQNQLISLLNEFYLRFDKAFQDALLRRLNLRANHDQSDKDAVKLIVTSLSALKGHGAFDGFFEIIRARNDGLETAKKGQWQDYFTSSQADHLSTLWKNHQDLGIVSDQSAPSLWHSEIETIWAAINQIDDWSLMHKSLEMMQDFETPRAPQQAKAAL